MFSQSSATANAAPPPALDLDPYAEDTIRNPYPFRAALRNAAPVVRLTKYGVYAVARYDDVKTVIVDHDRFSVAAGIGLIDRRDPESSKFRKPSPLGEVDPPVHTKTRSGMQKLLSPVVIRGWRERYQKVAADIIERVISIGGPFNAVSEIAEEMVYTVIPETLGLDVPREYLPGIGEMNFFSLGPMTELRQKSLDAVKDAIEFYDRSVERENVKPGTFGDTIYKAEDAGVFEPGTGIGLIRLFLRGGTDTSSSTISAMLRRLAENPDQWEKVKSDPSKIKNAFEETVRLDTPSEVAYRLTTRDMVFNGYELEGNRKIAFFLASANRDPRFWDNPDEFDVDRDVMGKHVGFGAGAHVCIGQMIARLMAETLMQALVARVDRIELAGEPQPRIVYALNSLKILPIQITPR
ncbi:hypothetical protein B0G57_14018 [Trinickia symbiotica]|uniref:Cytochrome P450 n=1 Tax=Trinickia symbiotica TaxID=863227 RepID=A0A2N7WL73_9BURK|nr:cytochrome P450 [Trinickia symbiotica]PMS30114.1 cytochrome P450 [Trinickia symbiotica]PPK41110.1 hypothetical protein B0G57_14018 [Trinickia symbiotica]